MEGSKTGSRALFPLREYEDNDGSSVPVPLMLVFIEVALIGGNWMIVGFACVLLGDSRRSLLMVVVVLGKWGCAFDMVLRRIDTAAEVKALVSDSVAVS